MSDWQYSGDVNIEYGGCYVKIDASDQKYGYANALRITDLDSGCGFTGAVLLERVTVILDYKRIRQAIKSCGMSAEDIRGMNREQFRLMAIIACLEYGHYDPDDSWDNYRTHWSETVQTQEGGPMNFDGWKATKFVAESDLKGYVESVWLD